MSRKKQAPKKIFYPDPKYGSQILAKFINFIMYDGKKTTSEKIIYEALDKIKDNNSKNEIKKDESKAKKKVKTVKKISKSIFSKVKELATKKSK